MSAAQGEFVALLGPSGCGKSTILRIIAGIESCDSGEIRIEGKVANYMRPSERNVAMVFQSYALYPHMTVRENIAFPLTTSHGRHFNRATAAKRVARRLSSSISPTSSIGCLPNSRAASASEWRWRARSSVIRSPSSWTNRFPTSTRCCGMTCVSR